VGKKRRSLVPSICKKPLFDRLDAYRHIFFVFAEDQQKAGLAVTEGPEKYLRTVRIGNLHLLS
jgi:hypothetical protein